MDSLVNAVFVACFLVLHGTLSIATVNCTYGDIRLYNGTTPNEGNVQICNNDNEWSGVCDYSWDCVDATVACRQLGYNDTTALVYTGSYFGEWNRVDFGAYSCSGTETNLIGCSLYNDQYIYHSYYCNSQKLAGVRCQSYTKECNNGEISLVGGESSDEGRLEICYNDIWTPVCVTNFHDEEAAVACKQLGYTHYSWGSIFTAGNTPLVKQYATFGCSSDFSESKLTECDVTIATGCTKYCDSVRLNCFNPPQCEEGGSRLVNGTIEQEGRLEVCVNGVWGTVCSSGWSTIDAYVACKQLGKGNSNRGPLVWYDSNQFSDGDYPIVVSYAGCSGWEKTITDCTHYTYGEFYCARTQVIGIQCYDDCEDGDIRLTGSDREHEGTVEICVDSLWGMIADSGWGQVAANIVCSQLGYDTTGIRAFNNSFYGKPKRPININNVVCTGSEQKLLDCSYYEFPGNEKKYLQKLVDVAGVQCGERTSEGTSPTISPTIGESDESDESGSSLSTRTPNYSAIIGGVYLILFVVIIMSIIFIIMGYAIYKHLSQNYNKILKAVKNTSVDTSTKPSKNNILSAVKNESYTSVNTSTKPALPSRNVPRLNKHKTPGVNKKDEDIELYEEP